MLAQRIKTIMPKMTFEEILEVTKIYSIKGINNSLVYERPFRSPHYSITKVALIGGGQDAKPGEISLATNGVLFLDEFPEFTRPVLESLRLPLEERKIVINRANATYVYPANFMLVAAMNPCPCGYFGSLEKECKCSAKDISKYLRKLSGPLLDRIDIQVEVASNRNKIFEKNEEESSNEIRKRVERARLIQNERNNNKTNSELSNKQIQDHCKINEKTKEMLFKAVKNLKLSNRSILKVVKVARTIADLENKEQIEEKHILEALQYRAIDKKYI